jgi:DNA-binding NtrC family response regulator
MKQLLVLNEGFENKASYKPTPSQLKGLDSQTVVIATIDPEIRAALTQLLERVEVEAICVSSVKEITALMAKKKVSACFCGFWLQDGTYREVVRHLRRERVDIPTVIISAPTCPQEFREYLSALNLGSLDVLSYPYHQADFDRMLEFAIPSRASSRRRLQVEAKAQFEVRGAA